MPATDADDMRIDEFIPLNRKSLRRKRNAPRAGASLSAFLGLALLLLVCAPGCAPPSSSSPGGDKSGSASSTNDLPELTEDVVRERINEAFVSEVPEESGAAEPISWRFDEDEPKEITVAEKQVDGARATLLLDIKTRSAMNMRNPRALAGRIRTEWELKTGWALRRWEIVRTENISMKYRNLSKPPAQNSNQVDP